jgi:hypothetical protein
VVAARTDDDEIEASALGLDDDRLGRVTDRLDRLGVNIHRLELLDCIGQFPAVLLDVAAHDRSGAPGAGRLKRYDADDRQLAAVVGDLLPCARERMPGSVRAVVGHEDFHHVSLR